MELIGAFTPGVPLPSIGKNKNLWFTITVTSADVTDLYEEKIEGDKYFFKDEWLPLKIWKEIIWIKG